MIVLEVKPGSPAAVEWVPITAGRRLLDVAGDWAVLEAAAQKRGDAFLRVTVRAEEPTPGLAARVKELLPNAVEVRVDHPSRVEASPPAGARVSRGPGELFAEYYQRRNATPLPAELRILFERTYEEASQ